MTDVGTHKCVFFGDSITAGQYVSSEHHWTRLVADRIVADPGVENAAFFVGAVSGSTSRQSLERFPHDVQAHRPDLVTIQFGLNDCNRWESDDGLPRVSERAFAANIVEMVERARRFGARKVILSTNHPTLRPTVFDDGTSYQSSSQRYNEIMREIASEVGAQLNDVEAGFEEVFGDDDVVNGLVVGGPGVDVAAGPFDLAGDLADTAPHHAVLGGALEQHVLVHVREAGFGVGLVGAADPDPDLHRDHGRRPRLEGEDGQALRGGALHPSIVHLVVVADDFEWIAF